MLYYLIEIMADDLWGSGGGGVDLMVSQITYILLKLQLSSTNLISELELLPTILIVIS